MKIVLTTGTGEGPTPLAAFDAALLDAGVANYNLIHLSSVIPPNTTSEHRKYVTPADEYGHRLYMVMAHRTALDLGAEACAGLGWTQDRSDGRGLFVECTGTSHGEVEEAIQATLSSMIKSRDLPYGPIECRVESAVCHGRPVCAMVMAVYKAEGWD